MRIAITHPYSWPEVRRGAERIIVETARSLAARGHDVTLLTSGREPGRTEADGFATVRFRRRLADAARHERWFGLRLLAPLAQGRYDVVHSMMPFDAQAAIRSQRITGHRTVYEELGIPPIAWEWLPDRAARWYVARHVDVYGCMSTFALAMLERWCHRPGALIPGGVRLSHFTPASRSEQPTILFSGALGEERKGAGLLLEALAVLSEEQPDIELQLSGPGDGAALLRAAPAAARRRTVVLPLGDPGEQADRYARAWVTALPSTYESFGLVLVESLACGTPIVVANHAAPPELAGPLVGAVCEPFDAGSLASALRAGLVLAEDPATAERCRAAAAAYDWDGAIAPLLEALYAG